MKEREIHFGAAVTAVRLEDAKVSEDRYGDFNTDEGHTVIRVRDRLAPSVEVDTLLHEIIHLVAESRYLNVPDQEEERIAQIIGTGLAEILLRNPWISRWIDKKRKETEE